MSDLRDEWLVRRALDEFFVQLLAKHAQFLPFGAHHSEQLLEIEVILRLGGIEIGRAIAGRKKDAAEMASRNALENNNTQELLKIYQQQELENISEKENANRV